MRMKTRNTVFKVLILRMVGVIALKDKLQKVTTVLKHLSNHSETK